MYKTVPRAIEYEMSVSGDIRRKDGLPCTVTIVNKQPMVTLVIWGKERTVAIEWLRLMTHFEVDLRHNDFWNVYFVPVKKWHMTNNVQQTMLFNGRRPEYKPGYRFIPTYTRYSISQDGVLIDTYTGETVTNNIETNRYITVYCYDPDRSKYRTLQLHRLVALAWVKNPDHLKYYLVNHIDGNKHNPHYLNLEWTDHKGNADHAFSTGLRSDNLDCKVRDIETKIISVFPTISKACEFMGIGTRRFNGFNFKRSVKLIKDRYELKLENDNTVWIYDNFTETLCPGRYKIDVTYPDGTLETFYDVRTLKRKLNIEITTSASVYKIVDRVKLLNPGIGVFVTDTYNTTPIQAYEISTGNIIENISVAQLAKQLNIHRGGIKIALEAGETRVFKGYAYRYKSNKKWNTQWTEAINIPKCILAIDKNGIEIECKSLREAELLTKVNRKAIRRALHGTPINTNWQFKK